MDTETLEKLLNRKMLTIKEVSYLLRISPSTIRQWIRQNKSPLPYWKVGKKTVFDAEDVQKYLER